MGKSATKDSLTREQIEREFLEKSKAVYIAKAMEARLQNKLLTRRKLKGISPTDDEKKLLEVSGDQIDTYNELIDLCDELLK